MESNSDAAAGTDDTDDRVELADPDDIGSDSLRNPHGEDATYREKNGDSHYGYKANLGETCGGENPFCLITTVQVDTTDESRFLNRFKQVFTTRPNGLSWSKASRTWQAAQDYFQAGSP